VQLVVLLPRATAPCGGIIVFFLLLFVFFQQNIIAVVLASQEHVEPQALLGLFACPGGGGRYVVAEILLLIGSDTATLRYYYSHDWKGKKDIVLSGTHVSEPLNGRKQTE